MGSLARWGRGILRVLLGLALSAIASGLIVLAGALALFAASLPRWLSLALEPVSLLLAPGVVASIVLSRVHDYKEETILRGDLIFYFLLVFVLLCGWDRRRFWTRPEA
jgi:hypothetical protein